MIQWFLALHGFCSGLYLKTFIFSDWAVFVEDNDNTERTKISPLGEGGAAFNPGSINSFITICDYDEEKYDEKQTRPNFKRGRPRPPA